jgi:hypothetical protein
LALASKTAELRSVSGFEGIVVVVGRRSVFRITGEG